MSEDGIESQDVSENNATQFNLQKALGQAEKIIITTNDRNKDGKLLAPNGEVSNLDDALWKLVRTDEFTRWFGDWRNVESSNSSKIVDPNGEPLLVYHGTNNEFETFSKDSIGRNRDSGYFGVGFYFTPFEQLAKRYGARLLSGFLNIRAPIIFDREHKNARYDDRDSYPESIEGRVQEIEEELRKQAADRLKAHPDSWTQITVQTVSGEEHRSGAITQASIEKGFDGSIGLNPRSNLLEYTAFESHQIAIVGVNRTPTG